MNNLMPSIVIKFHDKLCSCFLKKCCVLLCKNVFYVIIARFTMVPAKRIGFFFLSSSVADLDPFYFGVSQNSAKIKKNSYKNQSKSQENHIKKEK